MLGLFRSDRSTNAITGKRRQPRKLGQYRHPARPSLQLDNPAGDWKDSLAAAEKLANLLEGAQLIAMREPPTRTVSNCCRRGAPNLRRPARSNFQLHQAVATLRTTRRFRVQRKSPSHHSRPDNERPRVSAPAPRRLAHAGGYLDHSRRQLLLYAETAGGHPGIAGPIIRPPSPGATSTMPRGWASTRFAASSPTRPTPTIRSSSGRTSCTWCVPPTSAASA